MNQRGRRKGESVAARGRRAGPEHTGLGLPRCSLAFVLGASFAAAIAACGGGSGSVGLPGPDPAPAPEGEAPLLAAPAPEDGMQLTIEGFEVPAGGEIEVCQRIYLPDTGSMEIGGYEIKMPKGSHHFVVYAYEGDRAGEYPEGLFESKGCTTVGPSDAMNLAMVAGVAGSGSKPRTRS